MPTENVPTTVPQISKQPHRGGIVLALGILSLLIGCAGWILGIIAWTMANTDLARMNRGQMDGEGRSATQAGKICGIVSVCLHALGLIIGLIWLVVVVGVLGVAATAGAAAAAKSQQQHTSAAQSAEEKRITDIAAKAFQKQRPGRFEAGRPTWDGKSWTILISGLPPKPGDYCTYVISKDGDILETIGGR